MHAPQSPESDLSLVIAKVARTRPQHETVGVQQRIIFPALLHCPTCGIKHVDEGEWATREHRTHLCAYCATQWTPNSDWPTVGVAELP